MKRNIDQFWRMYWQPSASLFLLCCLCLAFPQSATAGIKACKQADGSTIFQDSACEVIPKTESETKKPRATIPFGIEETWFDRPPVVPDRAICTTAGCHCGMFSLKYKNGLPLAIADALYLDGSWHRLESTLVSLEMGGQSMMELADLRKARDEAACHILMAQRTLRLYGNEVMRKLNDKKRYAEERGLDDPKDCSAGDTLVCEHTDAITVYNRIRKDIRSLTLTPRVKDDDNQEVANGEWLGD